jgi:putative Mg2+ transporter-C (MgtC) family protein
LVGVAAALIVIAVGPGEGDVSRVMQGIVTGIGFLGAGVIVRSEKGKHVHNLTTAACVWLTACVGMACGVGEWRLLLVAAPIVAVILLFGGTLEKWVHQHWPGADETKPPPAERQPLP